jgi:hypothetical protein
MQTFECKIHTLLSADYDYRMEKFIQPTKFTTKKNIMKGHTATGSNLNSITIPIDSIRMPLFATPHE